MFVTIFKPINKDDKQWTENDYIRLKSCKPNIIKTTDHHQSSGYYASFGNKGSFAKAISSSVGQYTSTKSKSIKKEVIINAEASLFEKLTANEITRSVNNLRTVLPNIRSLIAPVLETSYELQQKNIDLNLKEGFSSKDGCWQTSLCVNAVTKQFHTEQDCTYTLISIPNQALNEDRYDFIFKINPQKHICIQMIPGLSFIFSGMYLTHRQNISQSNMNKSSTNFFNVASYGNKRLFTHIRTSLNKIDN